LIIVLGTAIIIFINVVVVVAAAAVRPFQPTMACDKKDVDSTDDAMTQPDVEPDRDLPSYDLTFSGLT